MPCGKRYKRIVKAVKRKGGAYNPYAVAHAVEKRKVRHYHSRSFLHHSEPNWFNIALLVGGILIIQNILKNKQGEII